MGDFPVIVLDFETSGLSPRRGDRAIEIGAVLVEGTRIRDRFQSLMNPGIPVSPFIQELTGITDAMLRQAPDGEEVMAQFSRFMGEYPLVAHNAPFDGRFLDAELARIGKVRGNPLVCTLQVARRIYPHIVSHKLQSLVRYKNLPMSGEFHRALADAEMTAHLWLALIADVKKMFALQEVPLAFLQNPARVSRARALACFA